MEKGYQISLEKVREQFRLYLKEPGSSTLEQCYLMWHLAYLERVEQLVEKIEKLTHQPRPVILPPKQVNKYPRKNYAGRQVP